MLEGEIAALTRPVAEEVKAEARVAQEGEMRARDVWLARDVSGTIGCDPRDASRE